MQKRIQEGRNASRGVAGNARRPHPILSPVNNGTKARLQAKKRL
jgi:hypothetical protein